jgi:hypothetical protein
LFDAEGLKAAVDGFSQVFGSAIWDPLSLRSCQACFGHDPDFLSRTVPGVHGFLCEPFTVVEICFAQAIDVGGVEQPNSPIKGMMDYGYCIRLCWPAFGAEP